MAKRKLSADEKERMAEEGRTKEVTAHPDKSVTSRTRLTKTARRS